MPYRKFHAATLISLAVPTGLAMLLTACGDLPLRNQAPPKSKSAQTVRPVTPLGGSLEAVPPGITFPLSGQPGASPRAGKNTVSFRGDLHRIAEIKRLENFLFEQDRKTVLVDLYLSPEQISDLHAENDRLFIPLVYADEDGIDTGSELLIDLRNGAEGLSLDEGAGRLRANLRVVSVTGPRQGIMSIVARPVSLSRPAPVNQARPGDFDTMPDFER
ncbi:MAG: hypothetical protein ACKV2V_06620 [Blastocatellia bacterium]